MKQSSLLNIAYSIELALEEEHSPDDVGGLIQARDWCLKTAGFGVTLEQAVEQTKKKTPAKKKSKEVLGATEDEAFELLKDESKPGPTLLKRTFGIATEAAVALYKKVEPRILEYKALKKKSKDINEVIAKLPKGTNTLLKSPLMHLKHLEPKKQARYLAGLKLEDVISSDELAKAAKDGYDSTQVDLVKKYTKKARPNAKDPVDIKKYQDRIMEWTSMIPDGGDLFNYMAEKGLNKTVIANFRDIALAIEAS